MTSEQQELGRSLRRPLPVKVSKVQFPFAVGLLLGLSAALVGVQWHVGPLSLSQIIAILVAALVVLRYPDRIRLYRPSMVDVSMLAFVVLMLAIEIFNAQQLLREPAPHVSFTWMVLYAAFFAARVTAETHEGCFSLLCGISAVAPAVAVFGVLQTLNLSWVIDLTVLLTEGGSSALDRYFAEGMLVRATGLIGHWTGFGSYLAAMALCLTVRMRLFGSRWQSILSLAVIGAGVVSTLTISVIVIYAGVVVVYFIGEKRVGRLMVFLAASAASIAFIFGDELTRRLDQQYGSGGNSIAASSGLIPETLVFRMSIWKNETIPAIAERFLTGWGPGAYGGSSDWVITPQTIVWKSSESQWFGILMHAGIVGFFAMAWLLVSFFRATRSSPFGVRILVNLFLALCFITSLTVSVFTNAGLGGALIPLLGAVTGRYARDMEPQSNVPMVALHDCR